MKKIISIVLIFLFCCSVLSAQKLNNNYQKLRDSLQTLSSYDTTSFFKIASKLTQIADNLKSPQKKADVLHIIGTYYYFRTDFNKTNAYYDSALSILERYPDRKLKNLIDLKRSYIWVDKGDFKRAKKMYAEKELNEPNDTMAQIILNMALGQIYQSELRHDSCLNKMYKALNYSIQKKDLYYEATTRNNLGGEFQTLGRIDDAKKEFILAVAIAKKINNKKLAANINSNIAVLYLQENKIKEALAIYQENLIFYENTNFYYEISYMYLNSAYCYSKLGDKINLNKYSTLAIKTVTEQKLTFESINVYIQIAKIFLDTKDYNKAIAISKEAMIYSQNNNVPIIQPSYYENLSNAYEAVGDNLNALIMKKKYINQKDSIDKASNNKVVNELIFKNQLAEKEKKLQKQQNENTLLKKENEIYNLNKTYYMIVIIMIVILSTVFGFYILERRVKKQKEIYASQLINDIDQERERIAMDLHDDLGLGITMVRQKLIKNSIPTDQNTFEIDQDLMSLLEKTRKISRDLFPSTLKHLRFQEFIDNLFKITEQQTGIICSYEIDNKIDNFELNIKTHILRIIQECIHNSIKYSGAVAIRLEIENINDKKTQITYFDNGIGFKKNMEQKGLGFKNINQRASLINAEVTIANNENNKGIKLTILVNDKS
jgi:signal transduction histidine kinase